MSVPITVLLADDDVDFRSVYRRLFHGTEDFHVVAEAGTWQEALQLMVSGRRTWLLSMCRCQTARAWTSSAALKDYGHGSSC